MKQAFHKQLSAYYHCIEKKLPYPKRERRSFMNTLANNVNNYMIDETITSMDDIYGQFGTPEEIAEAAFASAGVAQLERKMKFSMRLRILIVVAILLLFAGSILFYNYIHSQTPDMIEIQLDVSEISDEK